MPRQDGFQTLPMRSGGRKVRFNPGAWVTVALVIAIVVFAVLIIKDAVKKESPDAPMQITDLYGNPYTPVTPTPTPPLRPQPEGEGLLPVFFSANTQDNVVALTVQNADARAIETLLDACSPLGAHLTFFMKGEEMQALSESVAIAYLSGHEIESRGMNAGNLSSLQDEALANELDAPQQLMNAIAPGYVFHFLRTDNFSDDSDTRLMSFLSLRGYKGICRWALNEPRSFEQVAPGQIINFDLNNVKADRIVYVIQYLYESSYRIVSLNDLFAYESNLVD
ncbi:MAG: polysaccharide deacetylase family protein [Clostridiales bacterium]|nr:polysaccharide deacetylase family protein [Clostridiales bacterium]